MTDDPYIKEAIRRLNERSARHYNYSDDAKIPPVKVLAEAIAADKWQPPVDPRVEAVARHIEKRSRPTGFDRWQMRDAKDLAAEIIKIVDGAA